MSEHPDLIDVEGERWWWSVSDIDGEQGYQCRELFCYYGRDQVESYFGPVREVPSSRPAAR